MLLAAAIATPAAASTAADELEEPAFRVELDETGDATVSLVTVYDFEDADERDAFDSLAADESAQGELLDRFADRLDSVASDVETDRETSVAAESIDLRAESDRGIVVLTASWDGFAAVDDDSLVVDEPFASGFESDRTLEIVGPAEWTIESATPAPSQTDGSTATWDPGTDLDGFEVVFSTPPEESDDSADDDGSDGTDDESDGSADGDDEGETTDDGTETVSGDETPGFGPVAAALGAIAGLIAARSIAGRHDR